MIGCGSAPGAREMKILSEADVRLRPYGRRTGTGASGRTQDGQADSWTMGSEPGLCRWPPLRLVRLRFERECVDVRLRFERECVDVVCPRLLPETTSEEDQVRDIALDVHIDFCEVAIAEDGQVRSAGRIKTKPDEIELFAQSLGSEDRVALEVTGNAWEIARLIEPHVAQVLVVSPVRYRDPPSPGEDRPPRRPHPGTPARGRVARRGLDARPRNAGDAPAASASKPAGPGPIAG